MPAFPLCNQCLGLGYCRDLRTRLVSDRKLDDPEFIRDVRAYARAMNLSRDRWLPWLEDAYRDYPGVIVDANGDPVSLDFSVFETASIRYWFRDLIERETPAHIRPRLRREARERVRILATLLRSVDPVGTCLWGVRTANDHDHPIPTPRPQISSACRHKDRATWSPPEPANDNGAGLSCDELPF